MILYEGKATASKYSSFETFYLSGRRAREMNHNLYQKPIISQSINALYMIGFESSVLRAVSGQKRETDSDKCCSDFNQIIKKKRRELSQKNCLIFHQDNRRLDVFKAIRQNLQFTFIFPIYPTFHWILTFQMIIHSDHFRRIFKNSIIHWKTIKGTKNNPLIINIKRELICEVCSTVANGNRIIYYVICLIKLILEIW